MKPTRRRLPLQVPESACRVVLPSPMLLPLVRENAHMRLTDLPTDLLQCRHRAADWGIIRHSPLCSELYRPDGHGCDNGSNVVSSPRKPRSDQLELVYWACRFQQAPSSRRCVFYAEPKRGFLTQSYHYSAIYTHSVITDSMESAINTGGLHRNSA